MLYEHVLYEQFSARFHSAEQPLGWFTRQGDCLLCGTYDLASTMPNAAPFLEAHAQRSSCALQTAQDSHSRAIERVAETQQRIADEPPGRQHGNRDFLKKELLKEQQTVKRTLKLLEAAGIKRTLEQRWHVRAMERCNEAEAKQVYLVMDLVRCAA